MEERIEEWVPEGARPDVLPVRDAIEIGIGIDTAADRNQSDRGEKPRVNALAVVYSRQRRRIA